MLHVSDMTATGRILIFETHLDEVAKRREFIDEVVHIYACISEAFNARQPLVDRVGCHAACV